MKVKIVDKLTWIDRLIAFGLVVLIIGLLWIAL
jgi:hypothetical protein